MPIRVVAHSDETCALDVAARGALARDQVGALLGLGERRIGQIEDRAKVKLRAREIIDAALLTVPGIGWAWERHPATTHAAMCTVHMGHASAPMLEAALNLATSDWPEGIVLERQSNYRKGGAVCVLVVLLGDERQIASVARAWGIKRGSGGARTAADGYDERDEER